MSSYCADAPLNCSLNQLNNSSCSLVPFSNYSGDLCNEECWGAAENTVHYAFMSNGEPFTITMTYTNCMQDYPGWTFKGLQIGVTTDCCSGFINSSLCAGIPPDPLPPVVSASISGKLTACKIYYLTIDGYYGSYCDYTLSVTGGAANVPLVLKNINNTSNNIINLKRGVCDYKFKVEPRDAPCEGYYEWTVDGSSVDEHDREITYSFPDEGDFQVCVFGYVGLPNFNCGQSNKTCTTVKVRQDHFTGNTRVLCNELKGYKWFKQSIISSGTYTQIFTDKCYIYDSTIEFIILPKPQAGIVNYISCSNTDPYYDSFHKDYYKKCTANKIIFLPKTSEIYACDSSYLLNVAFADVQNKMHLDCKNGNIYMIPEIINHTDTCKIGIEMSYQYSWYEKINNNSVFITNDQELKITKKGNYQMLLILKYKKGLTSGSCNLVFDEDIDEDAYLNAPNTGSLSGKLDVCKGDIECYEINDIVRNPYSFSWSADQGDIVSSNPNSSKKICVKWNDNSTMNQGKLCVTYSDSCSSNLKACIDVQFGKSQKDIAGPNLDVKGLLGTQLHAKGQKGMWSYAGGPGTAHFTDPTDPNSRVRVSRFGSYTFKWTAIENGCETYGYVTVNFYIKFPEAEGESLLSTLGTYQEDSGFGNIISNYSDHYLTIQGQTNKPSLIRYKIVSIQGQVLYSGEIQSAGLQFDKQENLYVNTGIYFLILENDSDRRVNKFTVF